MTTSEGSMLVLPAGNGKKYQRALAKLAAVVEGG
jgi:hypothetical protein